MAKYNLTKTLTTPVTHCYVIKAACQSSQLNCHHYIFKLQLKIFLFTATSLKGD